MEVDSLVPGPPNSVNVTRTRLSGVTVEKNRKILVKIEEKEDEDDEIIEAIVSPKSKNTKSKHKKKRTKTKTVTTRRGVSRDKGKLLQNAGKQWMVEKSRLTVDSSVKDFDIEDEAFGERMSPTGRLAMSPTSPKHMGRSMSPQQMLSTMLKSPDQPTGKEEECKGSPKEVLEKYKGAIQMLNANLVQKRQEVEAKFKRRVQDRKSPTSPSGDVVVSPMKREEGNQGEGDKLEELGGSFFDDEDLDKAQETIASREKEEILIENESRAPLQGELKETEEAEVEQDKQEAEIEVVGSFFGDDGNGHATKDQEKETATTTATNISDPPRTRKSIETDVRSILNGFTDEGMEYTSVFDEALQLGGVDISKIPTEERGVVVFDALDANVFGACMQQCFSLDSRDSQTLAKIYANEDGTVRSLELLHAVKGVFTERQWQLLERLRFIIASEVRDWGLSFDLEHLFCDLTGGNVSGEVNGASLRSIVARYGWTNMTYSEANELIGLLNPCAQEGNFGYGDFVGLVYDPYFQVDVLPRLRRKVKKIGISALHMSQHFDRGVDSLTEFKTCLHNIGFSTGKHALSEEELDRISKRFVANGQATEFAVEKFISAVFQHKLGQHHQEEQDQDQEQDQEKERPSRRIPRKSLDTQQEQLDYEEMIFAEAKKREMARALAWEREESQKKKRETELASLEIPGEEMDDEENLADLDGFIQDDEGEMDNLDEDAWDNPEVLQNKNGDEDDNERQEQDQNQEVSEEDHSLRVARRLQPASDDILEFAIYLGMDPSDPLDREFLWLAEECLYAPLPPGWEMARDTSSTGRGDTYYWKSDDPSKQTQWEHPLDPFFRKMYERLKIERLQRERDPRLTGGKNRRRNRKLSRPVSALVSSKKAPTGTNLRELSVLRAVAQSSFPSGGEGHSILGQPKNKDEVEGDLSRRPTSALPLSSKNNRIVPFNQDEHDEETNDAVIEEENETKNRRRAWRRGGGRIQPFENESATVFAPEDKATEATNASHEEENEEEAFWPAFRPFPEGETRPLWWRIDHSIDSIEKCARQLTPENMIELATYFGLELPSESHLMWIIKLACLAKLPKQWKLCGTHGDHFFANQDTFQISRYHPLDPFFALLLQSERDTERAEERWEIQAKESWVTFTDEDGDLYFYDFQTNMTKYDHEMENHGNETFHAPLVVSQACLDEKHYEPYRISFWEILGEVDETHKRIPQLISQSNVSMLGKLELVKMTVLMEWLIEPKKEELRNLKLTNKELKSAVANRRQTSEQLTKHIAMKLHK